MVRATLRAFCDRRNFFRIESKKSSASRGNALLRKK
jgi:hypothetical protein